jgi:hypothetical protein
MRTERLDPWTKSLTQSATDESFERVLVDQRPCGEVETNIARRVKACLFSSSPYAENGAP